MATQIAPTVTPTMIGNVFALLRHRQRSLLKSSRANPGLAMLALTAILYFWIGRLRSGKKAPPRGKSVPHLKTRFFMLDVAYQYIKARSEGDELKWVQALSKQGLTLTTEVVGHCLILAFEPSSVQHMLVKNFENYPKGPAFHKAFFPFMGTGIFNSDGAAWKNQRALARPHFQVTEYKGAAHIETQINQVFDCVNALGVPQNKFVHAFNYTQKICGWKVRLCDYQALVPSFEFPQKVKDMDTVLLPIVDSAIARETKRHAEAVEGEENEHSHDNLLAHFLNSVDENGQPFDRIYLRDMLMNFLLAGRDTSTNLLTFMCYNLGKHPEVMDRLREEIFSVVGRDRKPDHEDIKKLKFLKQVINETLRLYPAVPFNIKTCLEDDVLPNGYFIPKGSLVVHSSYVTHRMKEYWGEDAEEFDPDRWGPERVKMVRPFMFFPFHAGPRICLGQNFAYNQAMNTMVRVMQKYTWKVVEGFEPKPESDITMYSRNGMQIIFDHYQ
ncbi:hypothetical protein BGZ97_004868 [Linnemannia gamsii]|uniref:Cytochrome P450 n=1 Tax=Linnemannia gamsii TaxID=64522 RepID=A0A9P6QR86_9FUNG|nr:hypothetical protein BGZ97_004868 [Linnemannia gamsii]